MSSSSPSRSRSAFQWPAPPTPSLSVKEILDKYHPNNNELLKQALIAKAEEDKKQTAQDILKTEQLRLHLRRLEFDLIRQQSTSVTRYPVAYSVPILPPPHPYYSLAPVQQQVIERITGPSENETRQYVPVSPIAHPHSAHPLCPPDQSRLNPPRHYSSQSHLLPTPSSQQPTTPVSPGTTTTTLSSSSLEDQHHRKRSHASISSYTSASNNEESEDKLSHSKVMEAIKAKIQRSSACSPSTPTAPSSAFHSHADKRQRTLPKPVEVVQLTYTPPPTTPSPRSEKPILPPIDTNVGCIKNLPSHPPLSPIRTSSPPRAAVSSIRSSRAYLLNGPTATTTTTTTTS